MSAPAASPAAPYAQAPDTPAMRQWKRFKEENPGCLLFFRLGDFYELFFDDAVTVHKVLGMTLTQRTEGVPMAGVPFHAAEGYLRRLIQAGFKVAVADQMEEAGAAKGLIERAVTRVITPGTLTDETLLEEGRENPLAAVALDGSAAALAFVELSTGRFRVLETPLSQLADHLQRVAPRELLFADPGDGRAPAELQAALAGIPCALSARPGWQFRDAADALKRQYGVGDLLGLGLAPATVGPAGAALAYLLETQKTAPDGRLPHLEVPRTIVAGEHLILDQASLRSLEVVETLRGGQLAGSLLGVFSGPAAPQTAMGKRRLRHDLCWPCARAEEIGRRHDAVAALVANPDLRERLRAALDGIQDLERISGRLGVARVTPRDLAALGKSAAKAEGLLGILAASPALAPLGAALAAHAAALAALGRLLGAACVDSPPPHLREGGLVRDGFDAALDECRLLERDAGAYLAAYQKRLAEETGIPTLKVGYNKVFGYYIELSASQKDKAPPGWHRKQTLTNGERFITQELKEFEGRALSASARAKAREQALFAELCAAAAKETPALLALAELAARADVLAAFAEAAVRQGWARPEMADEPVLHIDGGRHPVVEAMLGDKFVPNDTRLGAGPTLALITGPNMAGKSTYIRQAAIITLLAHAGSFVPATRARVGLTDRIFTRVGSGDELHAGRSTFMVEMAETANICHHASARSLVVLDEIGRGTSTLDGLALAWAIAEHMAEARCRCLFATHYHEMTTLADEQPAVANLSVSVREWKGEVVFLHRIVAGATDRSYGIHVAKLAGLPPKVVKRADALLAKLTVQHEGDGRRRKPSAAAPAPLFAQPAEHPLAEQLRRLDLDHLTPMQAFELLRKWKTEA